MVDELCKNQPGKSSQEGEKGEFMDSLCIDLNRPGGDSPVTTHTCPPPPPTPPQSTSCELTNSPSHYPAFLCVCFLLGIPAFHKKSLWMLPQAPSINCFVVSVRRFIDWQEQTLLVASGGSNLEKKVCSRQSRRRSATDCLFWPRSSHHFFPLFQSKVYISASQGMLGRGEGPTKHGQNTIIM